MIRNKISSVAIALLALSLCGGIFLWYQYNDEDIQDKAVVTVNEPLPSSQSDTNSALLKYATTTLPKDFSILERDTIYGEEEGKFKNLPSEGKALLISLLAIPGCDTNPEGAYCYENDWTVESGSIVAFKDGIILYSVANGKGGTDFSVFDLEQSTTTFKLPAVGQGLRNSKYFVNYGTTASPIMYYKVGMKTFGEILESRTSLVTGEQYSPSDYIADIKGKIDGDIATVSIFIFNLEESRFDKVREASFDLEKLP